MLTDVEIAQSAKMKPISEIAKKVGLEDDDLELYGKYKAKIALEAINRLENNPDGKLILVTAINPTPAGEGKTTTMIGLSQALNKLGKKSVVAMREPSLGPCFGIKGEAAGMIREADYPFGRGKYQIKEGVGKKKALNKKQSSSCAMPSRSSSRSSRSPLCCRC